MKPIGQVCALTRYPIKSMAGLPAESAFLGWHGLDGDRRFAFRRLDDRNGFPWLTASRVPELLLYHPIDLDDRTFQPAHVRTPAGAQLQLLSAALENEIANRYGGRVELMQFRNGIFDDAAISIINRTTIAAIGQKAGLELDPRRFRPNILLETHAQEPFEEDRWLGGRLVFGEDETGPAVSVTAHDVRCMMVNLDPHTARQDPRVLKAVVKLNGKNAGVYATVVKTGIIRVGQPVSLVLDAAP